MAKRTPKPAANWRDEALRYLHAYQDKHVQAFCSLPDLYMNVVQKHGVSIGLFHDGIRALVQEGQIRLHPFSAADRAISEFVSSGVTVTVAERKTKTEHKVSGQGVAFTPRLVVLVDENSASASEIVAGALQDHHRGLLVGNKTFGKGLVEQDYPLRNGGDLHLTIAYWYRPSGKSINLVGITPDRTVPLAHPTDLYEVDQPASDPTRDAQLQAALTALQ